MYRNHWEMEVYAKDFRERRWQEAAQRRLLDEASCGAPGAAVDPFNLGIARFLIALKTRLMSGSGATMPKPVFGAAASEPGALVTGRNQDIPSARPARLAQPYSDMVVIARGTVVEVAEQPSGVSEC